MKKRLLDLGLCVIGRHTHSKSKPLQLMCGSFRALPAYTVFLAPDAELIQHLHQRFSNLS